MSRSAVGSAVTILDVARAAGVSKSTVSRVLDERLPRSNSASAQKVRQAAEQLGYQRDVTASNLRRGSTSTIGVIVPRLTDTAMALFYEAVTRACARRHQLALVATTQDTAEAERSAVAAFLQRRADGLILTTARAGEGLAADLIERGVPHVLALRSEGESPAAVGDDELGGYLAGRHLLDLGHRSIAILAGPDYASSARGRGAGLRRAMLEAGLDLAEEHVLSCGFSMEAGAAGTRELFARDPGITALFAVTDNLAIGALSALSSMGRRVPDDVSIVGYNDIPLASFLPVPLTSVRVAFDELANASLDLLAQEELGSRRVVTPSLIPRRSTIPRRR